MRARRDSLIHFRVTHAVRKFVLAEAHKKGMTLSQWFRWLIGWYIEQIKEESNEHTR